MASPREIAKVIFFLGSNDNTFISNEIISISGGGIVFKMEEVGKVQEKALINSKIYLNQFSKSKYDFSKNNIFYLSSFANCIGLMKIKNFLQIEENPIKKTYIILKDIFYSAYYVNNYCHKFENKFNFNQIVVSWANKRVLTKMAHFTIDYLI